VPTGGIHPISVAQFGNLVYVLHDLSGDLTGFLVDASGRLRPIPGSARTVTGANAAAPFNILFDHTGTTLVVSDSNTQFIDIFTVDPVTGLTTGPFPQPSAGIEPFGMFFDAANHLLVSEGALDLPLSSTMSSYDLQGTRLQTISGAVKDFRQFSCWIAVTTTGFNGGQFVYVSNNGDSTISSFFLKPDGSLSLVQPVAATTGSAPLLGAEDETISSDGAFLYVTSFGTPLTGGFVNAYAIQADGTLARIQQVSGLPIGVAGSAGR
jgi:6-phosphogluconolactonase (cycloisomerase 2 family)